MSQSALLPLSVAAAGHRAHRRPGYLTPTRSLLQAPRRGPIRLLLGAPRPSTASLAAAPGSRQHRPRRAPDDGGARTGALEGSDRPGSAGAARCRTAGSGDTARQLLPAPPGTPARADGGATDRAAVYGSRPRDGPSRGGVSRQRPASHAHAAGTTRGGCAAAMDSRRRRYWSGGPRIARRTPASNRQSACGSVPGTGCPPAGPRDAPRSDS